VTAYDNDPRVKASVWGSSDRDVTYRIAAADVPVPHPQSDLSWRGFTPGDAVDVNYIQDGHGVNGWVVFAEGADHYVKLNDWGAFRSVDVALKAVLGDPR
jgi:hypothetical protein